MQQSHSSCYFSHMKLIERKRVCILNAWGFAEILPKICNLTIEMNADMQSFRRMTLIYIFSPFFCTTTYRWSPHPSSAGGHNMLLTKRIPRQLSVSGFLYLNPQAPGNWACNVDSNMAPSVSVGSSMAGSDSSSVTLTYWSILDSSESSLSMLKISCESILPLIFQATK